MSEKTQKPNPRKELVKKLSVQLENEFVVADHPDHPFLLIQPDVIVGGKGLLTALFFPSAAELGSPRKLLARLILSRLGLPAHTKCVLMIDPKKPIEKIHNEAMRHFHEILEISRWGDLILFIKDAEAGKRVKPVPPDIRKQAFERYTVVMKDSARWADRDESTFDAKRLMNEFENKEYLQASSSSQIIKYYEHSDNQKHRISYSDNAQISLIKPEPSFKSSDAKAPVRQRKLTWMYGEDAVVALFNQQAKLDKLKDIISVGAHLNYKLNEGVPTSPNEPKINFIALDEIPVNRIDPEKPLRAGAFAGWLFMRPKSVDEVEETNRFVSKSLQEALQQ